MTVLAVGLAIAAVVTFCLGHIIAAILRLWGDLTQPLDKDYRSNQGRRLPPRSPAHRKRGL